MSKQTTTANKKRKTGNIRYLTVTAMLSAVAYILMFLDFSVPFMPAFIKMDLSELPALIGAFAIGPGCGVTICLVKNILHLLVTSTAGVGEVSNFILGAAFVFPAGIIYKYRKNKKMALFGSLLGAFFMSVFSVVSNYFFVYPMYYHFMPEEVILSAYQAIFPFAETMLQCLILFNMPFTFLKGLLSVVITFFTYKHISAVLKER